MNVVLIGYRGTGKSTVARLLAQRWGWPSIDADDEIERRAGKSIQAIFAEDGESRFRDLESEVVAELVARDHVVLALGGGAVMRQENRRQLGDSRVVWLQADPGTIDARLAGDPATAPRRPQLTAVGGLDEITDLLAQREPVYRECADYQVNTVDKTPEQLADEIVCLLQGFAG